MFGKKYELVACVTQPTNSQYEVVIAKGSLARVSQYASMLNEAEPDYCDRASIRQKEDETLHVTVQMMFCNNKFHLTCLDPHSRYRWVMNPVLQNIWHHRIREYGNELSKLVSYTDSGPCKLRDEVKDIENIMNSLAYSSIDMLPIKVLYFFRVHKDPIPDLPAPDSIAQ